MGKQMLNEDQLPTVLDLHNQAIVVALDVEDRVRIYEVGVAICLSNIHQILLGCAASHLVPLRDWALQRGIGCDGIFPRLLADHMH